MRIRVRKKKQGIGLVDLDREVADAIREKEAGLRQMLANTMATPGMMATLRSATTTDEQRRAVELETAASNAVKRSTAGKVPTAALVVLGPLFMFVVAMFILISSGPGRSHPYAPFFPLIVMPMAFLPVFLMAAQRRRRRSLPLTVVRAVLPLVGRNASERAYCTVADEVLASAETLGAEQARMLLGSLNDLLGGLRRLDTELDQIGRGMAAQTLEQTSAERERLRERLEATNDPSARETLQQGLALCDSRLEKARGLAPLRERLEAQREMILQTFASVQASLAGLCLAPSEMRMQGPTEEVRESVAQIDRQTRAVEQAVQEVLRLRA
jgi:hypothetical protein